MYMYLQLAAVDKDESLFLNGPGWVDYLFRIARFRI